MQSPTIWIEIEDVFFVKGRGAILVPRWPWVVRQNFRPFKDSITLQFPNTAEDQFDGIIELMHFSISDSEGKHVPGGKLNVTVRLPALSREDVPRGSKFTLNEKSLALIRL